MAKNKANKKHINKPVEEQDTAAWASIENLQSKSRTPLPSDLGVKNAKEYVDTNQK